MFSALSEPYMEADRFRQQDGFVALRRDALVDSRGVRYRDFRQTLTPRYARLWLQLLSGHAALLVTTVLLGLAYRRWPASAPAVVVIGGGLYGYALAYILLFFHEAAHYNLAPDRKLNDRLANALIGIFIGQRIETYRPVHFEHHRQLGTPLDSERTYFDELNARFILDLLTGVKVLNGLLRRDAMAPPAVNGDRSGGGGFRTQITLGALLTGGIVIGAFALGFGPLGLAWVVGLVIVFPFLAAIRQLLEHRGEHASGAVDYAVVPHGAVNRLFGSGPLADTLGGAGFNRHLLHHWEPQISCTRLRELEAFLRDTDAAAEIAGRQSTYLRTFAALFRRGKAAGAPAAGARQEEEASPWRGR